MKIRGDTVKVGARRKNDRPLSEMAEKRPFLGRQERGGQPRNTRNTQKGAEIGARVSGWRQSRGVRRHDAALKPGDMSTCQSLGYGYSVGHFHILPKHTARLHWPCPHADRSAPVPGRSNVAKQTVWEVLSGLNFWLLLRPGTGALRQFDSPLPLCAPSPAFPHPCTGGAAFGMVACGPVYDHPRHPTQSPPPGR